MQLARVPGQSAPTSIRPCSERFLASHGLPDGTELTGAAEVRTFLAAELDRISAVSAQFTTATCACASAGSPGKASRESPTPCSRWISRRLPRD